MLLYNIYTLYTVHTFLLLTFIFYTNIIQVDRVNDVDGSVGIKT